MIFKIFGGLYFLLVGIEGLLHVGIPSPVIAFTALVAGIGLLAGM